LWDFVTSILTGPICLTSSHLPVFEFPAIGHIYDAKGQLLIELAKEHRQIVQYGDIPPIVRDAILAAEDRNFFSHNGVDYSRIPRVLSKVRNRGRC